MMTPGISDPDVENLQRLQRLVKALKPAEYEMFIHIYVFADNNPPKFDGSEEDLNKSRRVNF